MNFCPLIQGLYSCTIASKAAAAARKTWNRKKTMGIIQLTVKMEAIVLQWCYFNSSLVRVLFEFFIKLPLLFVKSQTFGFLTTTSTGHPKNSLPICPPCLSKSTRKIKPYHIAKAKILFEKINPKAKSTMLKHALEWLKSTKFCIRMPTSGRKMNSLAITMLHRSYKVYKNMVLKERKKTQDFMSSSTSLQKWDPSGIRPAQTSSQIN